MAKEKYSVHVCICVCKCKTEIRILCVCVCKCKTYTRILFGLYFYFLKQSFYTLHTNPSPLPSSERNTLIFHTSLHEEHLWREVNK